MDDGPLVLELQLGLDGDGEDGQCASNVKHGVEGVTMTVGMGEFIVSRVSSSIDRGTKGVRRVRVAVTVAMIRTKECGAGLALGLDSGRVCCTCYSSSNGGGEDDDHSDAVANEG